MGFCLLDRTRKFDHCWDVNFWHWRAIVEAIRRLQVLPENVVDGLHVAWSDNGLTKTEAASVARALRAYVEPIAGDERILWDGSITAARDDLGTLHRGDDWQLNYGTNKEAIEAFCSYCESCDGFEVIQ